MSEVPLYSGLSRASLPLLGAFRGRAVSAIKELSHSAVTNLGSHPLNKSEKRGETPQDAAKMLSFYRDCSPRRSHTALRPHGGACEAVPRRARI